LLHQSGLQFGLIIVCFRFESSYLNLDNPTSKRLATPFWGFLFLITLINGFQLRTIKRFCNKANEKRQNNKSNKFKIIKVESTPSKKTCSD
jgi:hypothetical protein